MARRVLITGGAGFIGSHLADLLLAHGWSVRILDRLLPQVHAGGAIPNYIKPDTELVVGDVRNAETVEQALRKVDAVVHLAAAISGGRSMHEIDSCTEINELGTAVLLDALAKRPVERLVCASSMSIYGEGPARTKRGEIVEPKKRSTEQLHRAAWELEDENGDPLTPLPTPESKLPSLSSVYARNKYYQERLCLIAGKTSAIPTVALPLFPLYPP